MSAASGARRSVAAGVGAAGSTGSRRALRDGGRRRRLSGRLRRASLPHRFRTYSAVVLSSGAELDLFVPVGIGTPPPLDAFVASTLEHRQRLPAGFFLGLLGPALIFLELLVDLLLGLLVLGLGRLGVALKGLDDLVARPGISASMAVLSTLYLSARCLAAARYSASSRSIRLRKPSSVSDSPLARAAISASRSVSATVSF